MAETTVIPATDVLGGQPPISAPHGAGGSGNVPGSESPSARSVPAADGRPTDYPRALDGDKPSRRLAPVVGGQRALRRPRQAETRTISLKDVARGAALAAEREAMAKVLEQTRWNRVRAAKLLNISYRTLLYKIQKAGLAPAIKGRVRE